MLKLGEPIVPLMYVNLSVVPEPRLPSVVTPAIVMTDVQPLPPSQAPIAANIAISM